jgi:hypothetical protein
VESALGSSGRLLYIHRSRPAFGRRALSRPSFEGAVTDFFREVQEDLQRDRILKLWRRFRLPLLGLVVAIIAAVVVVVVVQDAGKARNQKDGATFAAAAKLAEAGKDKEAAAAFAALAGEASGGYIALARLREADAAAAAGDRAGAVAALDALAKDGRVDPVYRDLANLLAVERLLDDATPEELSGRLAVLMAPDSPWRWLATELDGVARLKAGRTAEARSIFTELVQNQGVPLGVRSRSAELLAGLGGPLPPKEAAPEAATPPADPEGTAAAAPAAEGAPAAPAPAAPAEGGGTQ